MTADDEDRDRRAAASVLALSLLTKDLLRASHTAGRAAVGGDVDALCEAAEDLLELHAAFAAEYRRLLAVRVREPRQASYGVVTKLPLAGPERSSW